MSVLWVNVILITLSILVIITGSIYFVTCKQQYKDSDDEEEGLHIKNCKSIISVGVLGLALIAIVNIINLL